MNTDLKDELSIQEENCNRSHLIPFPFYLFPCLQCGLNSSYRWVMLQAFFETPLKVNKGKMISKKGVTDVKSDPVFLH